MTTSKENQDHAAENHSLGMLKTAQSTSVPESRRRVTIDQAVEIGTAVKESVSPEELAAKFAKRRRFIKIGASTVPVALTLTSRPVLAWHCTSTSAWGSVQIAANTSAAARHEDDKVITNECWTIKNWKDNTTRANLPNPWKRLGLQSTYSNKTTYYQKYKVSSLYPGLVGVPKGLNTDHSVWALLADKVTGFTATKFQKYMLVARLNAKCLPATVGVCLKNANNQDQLVEMASGIYKPKQLPGVVWYEAQIIDYLDKNWIVQVS